MSRRAGVFACALAAIAGALAMPLSAASYRIDPRDTTAEFEVRFLGVFPIRGEFRRTTGALVYDHQLWTQALSAEVAQSLADYLNCAPAPPGR